MGAFTIGNYVGRAYVYRGSAKGLSEPPAELSGSAADGTGSDVAEFGATVGGGGDVNADGYADLLVGAPSDGNGNSLPRDNDGAFLYAGGAFPPKLLGRFSGQMLGSPNGLLGFAVTFADLDADGYSDVVLAAPQALAASSSRGTVEVHFGGSSNPSGNPMVVTLPLASAFAGGGRFGASVASADVNGDGRADLFVGDQGGGGGPVNGRVFGFFGTGRRTLSTPDFRLDPPTDADGGFGRSLARAGRPSAFRRTGLQSSPGGSTTPSFL